LNELELFDDIELEREYVVHSKIKYSYNIFKMKNSLDQVFHQLVNKFLQ
jgi:hypothetical protein